MQPFAETSNADKCKAVILTAPDTTKSPREQNGPAFVATQTLTGARQLAFVTTEGATTNPIAY